ncbi:MAG: CvpA family protein [Burkholderiaceae bacterium]|jgi:membrane protein required for colicin V production|nr:CvpA family protein [Burkholderiaceae bacterium]
MNVSGFTAFDYTLLFVLGCSVIIGIMRGFLREAISLASWVVAFVVASRYGGTLAPMLPSALSGETLRLIVAFVALFIGAKIIMMLLAKIVDALVSAGGLSGLNRVLGCIFGLARGILISLVVVLLCGMTSIPQQPFWKNARFSPLAERAALMTLPFIPGSLARNIKY